MPTLQFLMALGIVSTGYRRSNDASKGQGVEGPGGPRGRRDMSFEPELLLETSRFRVIRKRRTLGDGSQFEREIIEHPGAAVILPLVTPDQVCLIRNYRISVDTE